MSPPGDRGTGRPSLAGRHVYLRPVESRDYSLIKAMDTTPELVPRWRFRGATPSPDQWTRSTWQDVLAQFIIARSSDDVPIGIVVLYAADLEHGRATFAAGRFDPVNPSPLMVLGLAIFLRYVFATWTLRKLYMELPEFNLSQFGSGLDRIFKLEARLSEYHYYDGRHWDHLILTIDRELWGASKGRLVRAEDPPR